MGAKTDFWLAIHNVCLCYEQEGDNRQEQAANVAEAWASMPKSTRQAVAQELQYLLAELSEVESELLMHRMATASDGDGRIAGFR